MIGARIKQARLLAGMTLAQLANELQKYNFSITKQAISKYESEKSYPSAQFLLLASSVLGVPSTYFSHQPAKTVKWLAFRCRKRLSQKDRNRIKAFAGDVAELQIELRELLYPNAKFNLPSIAVSTFDEAEKAAEKVRSHWNVGDRPLDNLVQTAEDRNIVVISWKDSTGLFDGLSAQCDGRPIAVIDTSVPTERQRLSLAHEIGHLVMDVEEMPQKEEEKLAFRFAAALLVPAEHAYHELGTKRHHLDWGELESLKRKYGMSMGAWIRRAHDLDIINDSAYTSMNRFIRSRGWHRDEPGKYLGDEQPLQLKQMAQRALAEGLMTPDRIMRVGIDAFEHESAEAVSTHLTVHDLLQMPKVERRRVMESAFALAADEDFEVFEADQVFEDFDEEYDAENICETE